MPIKNYTTKINALQTVEEIQRLLVKFGATSIVTDYTAGHPSTIMFILQRDGQPYSYRLPANWRGVYTLIARNTKVPRPLRSEQQAIAITWRIVQDWLEAHLALIEAEVIEVHQLFLPYMVAPSGETLYQIFVNNRMQLPEG